MGYYALVTINLWDGTSVKPGELLTDSVLAKIPGASLKQMLELGTWIQERDAAATVSAPALSPSEVDEAAAAVADSPAPPRAKAPQPVKPPLKKKGKGL